MPPGRTRFGRPKRSLGRWPVGRESNRALCKAFVLEVVAQEPRVEDTAVGFAFDIESEGPSELRFSVTVQPVDGSEPVTVGLGVEL